MSESEGISMPSCRLDLGACYRSCDWWRDGKCTFPKRDLRTEKELEDLKALRESSRIFDFEHVLTAFLKINLLRKKGR